MDIFFKMQISVLTVTLTNGGALARSLPYFLSPDFRLKWEALDFDSFQAKINTA